MIDNLPNHLKDKKEYLIKLKDSIDIPITCIKYKKYGHHATECEKVKKLRKEKIRKKRQKRRKDGVDISY